MDLKKMIKLPRTVITDAHLEEREIKFAGDHFQQQYFKLNVRPNAHWEHKCPHCLNSCSVYDHQSGEVAWRAPGFNGTIVTLNYSPARIICPEHGVVREYIPWADGTSRFTVDFNNNVTWMAMQLPKSAIAVYFQINWHTVGNCIKATHDRLEPDPSLRLNGLRKFCIDETSYSKGHKYITVVYDMERLQVVWVHPGHGLDVFQKFAESLTDEQKLNVEIVAGDGARWIDTGTSQFFPNASRCIDIFHLVGWCNEALDDVRKEATKEANLEYQKTEKAYLDSIDISKQALEEAELELIEAAANLDGERVKYLSQYIEILKQFNQPDQTKSVKKKLLKKLLKFLPEDKKQTLLKLKELAKTLKNARYAVTKNPENRTACQDDKISLIAVSMPMLYIAFQLKEALRSIVHMDDVEGAAHELDRWIAQALNSGIAAFVTLAEKIKRHRENLLNSIRYKANSSQSESCNALIKTVIHTGKGFRNLNNLSALIYLKCSTITIPLANRPQFSAAQKEELRRRAKEYRQKRAAVNQAA